MSTSDVTKRIKIINTMSICIYATVSHKFSVQYYTEKNFFPRVNYHP